MGKGKRGKRKDGKKAGLIAFGATLMAYALLFPFHKLGHFLIGGSLATLVSWAVKTMATPMQGLDKHAKAKAAMDVTIIKDDYARQVVETGVSMLDALKTERDAINEYVFTRRIDELRERLDKVLRNIIDDPDEARYLRKMNSYYLPTMVKLLQGYREAKSRGADYAIMAERREDVLGALDQLNDALDNVLDTMLRNDLEDMDVEIDVFERMLKSDGLQPDDVTEALRRSAHAAAEQSAAKKKASAAPELTASASQLRQGAPVLKVPDAPHAPDLTEDIRKRNSQ